MALIQGIYQYADRKPSELRGSDSDHWKLDRLDYRSVGRVRGWRSAELEQARASRRLKLVGPKPE